jgi:hypothetical protein
VYPVFSPSLPNVAGMSIEGSLGRDLITKNPHIRQFYCFTNGASNMDFIKSYSPYSNKCFYNDLGA